jgi:uncharacterized protein YaaQ
MKVVIAVAQEADVPSISEDLRAHEHRFTRIPSFGGFLEEENTTFLLAVEDEQVAGVVECFERSAHARDVDLPPVLLERLADWRARTVHHGGATILVMDLAAFHRT